MSSEIEKKVQNVRKSIDQYIEKKVEEEVQKWTDRLSSEENLQSVLEKFEKEFSSSFEETSKTEGEKSSDTSSSYSTDSKAGDYNLRESSENLETEEIERVSLKNLEKRGANKLEYDISEKAASLLAICQIYDEDPSLDSPPSYREIEKGPSKINDPYLISRAYKELEKNHWIERKQKDPGEKRPVLFKRKLENPENYLDK